MLQAYDPFRMKINAGVMAQKGPKKVKLNDFESHQMRTKKKRQGHRG